MAASRVRRRGDLPACTVALILSGGVRDFHMTATSMVRHLITPFSASDVCLFLRTLLDPDAHKLRVLLHLPLLHIAVIQVDKAPVQTRLMHQSVRILQADQANRSAQELLQLEDAQRWVEVFEAQRKQRFQLVIRARFDSYWSGPIPRALVIHAMSMDNATYIVPKGKTFRGLNDRLGLSSSTVASIVNKRASMLEQWPPSEPTQWNSEQWLNITVARHAITPQRILNLPFCLLVKRKCRCCMAVNHCTRSGNKCRPCSEQDERAQRANRSYELSPQWPANYAERFDATVPAQDAAMRQRVERQIDLATCRHELTELTSRSWMRAPANIDDVCRLAHAENCLFDANLGRWVGNGCYLNV